MSQNRSIPEKSLNKYLSEPWRKARLAIRLTAKSRSALTPRQKAWARALLEDPSVTDRLLTQAKAWHSARHHV